jgi:hypothetical protein
MPWKCLIRTKVLHSGCNLALAGCGYRRAKIGWKGMISTSQTGRDHATNNIHNKKLYLGRIMLLECICRKLELGRN